MKDNLNNSLSRANDYVDTAVFSLPNNLSKRILQNIFENPSLSYFFFSTEYNYTNLKYIQNYFNSMLTSNKQISSISIYYGNNDYLITPYYNGFLSNVDEGGQFSGMLKDFSYSDPFYWLYVGSPSVFTGPTASINLNFPRETKFLYFIRKIPSVAFSTEYGGSIIIAVNEQIFHKEIRNFFPADTDVFITSLDGTILFSSKGSYVMDNISKFDVYDSTYNMIQPEGNYIKKINGIDTLVSYKRSTYSNYMYVSLSPVNQITSSFSLLFRILGLVAFLTFLIGIILSFYSAKLYSEPLIFLKNLCVSILNKYLPDTSHANEYELINYTVDVLSDKLNKHETSIKEVSPLVYEHIFVSLVNNDFSDPDINEKLKFANVNFSKEFFATVIFKTKISSIIPSGKPGPEYIFHEIMETVKQFAPSDEYEFINSKIKGNPAFIFNFGKDANFTRAFTNISSHMSKFSGINIYIGISDIYTSLDKMSFAYKDALRAVNYSFMTPGKTLYFFTDIKMTKKENPILLTRLTKQMKTHLNSHSWDNYIAIADNLYKLIAENHFSYDDVILALENVISAIYTYSSEYNIVLDDILKDPSELMRSIDDINDFHILLNHRISHISNIFDRRRNNKNNELISAIKQFVDDNISSDRISQDALADNFGISSAHLSRIFKEAANENFIEYVTTKKLEYAKDKLLSTNMSVENISKMVGYANTQYFISKFKTKYGKTPQKFRLFYRDKLNDSVV